MMETKYYWALCKPPDKQPIDSNGTFAIHMEKAFGAFPIELTDKNVERLEGMAATWDRQSISPYVLLIRAIFKYKAIRIWGENE